MSDWFSENAPKQGSDWFAANAPAPAAEEPGLLRRAVTRPFSSVVPKQTQADVVGAILGHPVAAAPEDPTVGEMLAAAKAAPIKTAGGIALGLTGIPSILDLLKTAYEAGPDIARGLVNHPVETLRGGVAGIAEGAMQQATPVNALLLAAGRAARMKAPAPEAVTPTAVRSMPNLVVPREMPRLVKPSVIPPKGLSKLAVTGPGKIVGKAPTVQGSIEEALSELRGSTPPAVESPVGSPMAPAPEAPAAPIDTSKLGKAAKDIVERRVSQMKPPPGVSERRYVELLKKYGGKAEQTYTEGTLNKFAEMMGEKGAQIDQGVDIALKTGNVEHAATQIEQKVKLTVDQLARAMRDRYGSQRAGKMLQPNMPAKVGAAQVKRLAPGPSKMPEIVKESIADTSGIVSKATPAQAAGYATTLKRYSSEGGAVDPKLLLAAGGGAAGAAVGGSQGETAEERVTNAAIGGITGAVAVPLLAHVAASSMPGAKKLQGYIYSSVLSSPQSMIKAYMGGAGGAVAAAMEKFAAGQADDGARILNAIFSKDHVAQMREAFKGGGEMGVAGGTSHRVEGGITKAFEAAEAGAAEHAPTIVGRAYNAVNEPFVRAMMAGGVSREDAIRYTLSGLPTTPMGKDILGLWSRYFPLRLATSLFPRVGVQVLERGVERSPLGLMNLKGINEGVSGSARLARAAAGTSAGVGAYMASDQVPDWAKPYMVALSGVYGLPVGVGMAVAGKQGKGLKAQLMAGTQAVTKNMPFPQFGPAEAFNPDAIASLMVPNLLRDVARAQDPYERDTRGAAFGRARAKVPGLREQLPIKGRNVNIAGQPNEDRSSAFERFLSPAAPEPQPMKGIPPAVVKELARLDVQINAPSFEKEIPLGKNKVKVPAEAAERARAERRQFLVPQIEKLIASDSYKRANDEQKAARLRAVIRRAETAGEQRARASLIRTLRQTGALRAGRSQ